MDYEIRLAVLSDARRLAEVKIACWETTYRGIYPDSKFDNYDIDKNIEKFENIINNEYIDLYVVVVNGDIAEIRDLTEKIMRLKGVEHVKLTSTANGEDFKEPGHSHDHPHTH